MWHLGLRYRKHPQGVIGKPDYAFLRPKVAIFCDGDFWHGEGWRKRGFQSWGEQFEGLRNSEFWRTKVARNMKRDEQVNRELNEAGWVVLRFLESEILGNPEACAASVRLAVCKRKQAVSCR